MTISGFLKNLFPSSYFKSDYSRPGTKPLIAFAKEYPEVALGAGLGLYWMFMPKKNHNDPAKHHNHDYCGPSKYLKLIGSVLAPTAADYLFGNEWEHRSLRSLSHIALVDEDNKDMNVAEQKAKIAAAIDEKKAHIRQSARLAMTYDLLDGIMFKDDDVLTPKQVIDKDGILGKFLPGLAGKNIDYISLILSLYDTKKLFGEGKSLSEFLKLYNDITRTAGLGVMTLAETWESRIPTVWAWLGYETVRYTSEKTGLPFRFSF